MRIWQPCVTPSTGRCDAMIPARYRASDVTLSLFSTIAQFGTAEDIALADMKIEMLFPADDTSRIMLLTMFGSGDEATDRKPA